MNTLTSDSTLAEIAQRHRQQLHQARRIVVKVGTQVITNKYGTLNVARMRSLVNDIAVLAQEGYQMLLVSSAAIAAGMQALHLKQRPSKLVDLQMAASIGQLRLINTYSRLFKKHHLEISQILLTHDDIGNDKRRFNAQNTLLTLCEHGFIPVINENDAVAVDEIKLGDNDVLSAHVCNLVNADLLILLSSPDGLQQPINARRSKRIPFLQEVNSTITSYASHQKSTLGSGGMKTKLEAVKFACNNGTHVVIACGKHKDILQQVIAGDDVGTLFAK